MNNNNVEYNRYVRNRRIAGDDGLQEEKRSTLNNQHISHYKKGQSALTVVLCASIFIIGHAKCCNL